MISGFVPSQLKEARLLANFRFISTTPTELGAAVLTFVRHDMDWRIYWLQWHKLQSLQQSNILRPCLEYRNMKCKEGEKKLTNYRLITWLNRLNKCLTHILPLSLKFTLTLDLISFLVFKPAGGLKEPNLHIHLSSWSFNRWHSEHLHLAPPTWPTLANTSSDVSMWSTRVMLRWLKSPNLLYVYVNI